MAAARKSDADKPKKSIMPRLFVGVWLVALTVLLVIMFTNMPEKRNGGQGKELVKKITAPLPEEIEDLATRASVNQLENRVETVETKTAQADEIRRKVAEHDGDIAVLDQRVDRLETTVSDKLSLPSRSFSEIPTAAAEKPEPAKTAPAGKTPKEPADKTADPPPPVETPADGTAASTPSAQPTDGTTASASTPQPTDKTETPSATEQPAADGKKPTSPPRKTGVAAGPAAAPSDIQAETPADRRSVRRKIAAREAYIRRTAPLRRTGDWTPPAENRSAMTAGDRGAAPPSAEGFGPDEYAGGGAGRVQPPYAGKRGGLPIGAPAGSLHRAGSRFGHRVDLSDKLNGAADGRDPKPYGAKTAPGMTIFPDRRLDPMKID